jgi:hypothetical protein
MVTSGSDSFYRGYGAMSLLLLILRGIGMNSFALVADFEKESHKNYSKMKTRRNMT